MDRQSFIALLAPQAIQARLDGSSLLPSVRLAQNILETGSNLNKYNNLGGFKVGDGKPNAWWHGETYTTPTWEVYGGKRVQTVATWRAYDSVYDFYRDQDRLFQNSRYAPLRAALTPEDQAKALQACGYATDPEYAAKLMQIVTAEGLIQYDGEVMPKMDKKDADKIIDTYLKPQYADAIKRGDRAEAAEANRLANELRKASGQPTQ
ncbi:glycoside hydrolase family 73 protein [Cohnella endophytica]|nr:glucosaminidase domain-containing protein [Cohnella endophytica]